MNQELRIKQKTNVILNLFQDLFSLRANEVSREVFKRNSSRLRSNNNIGVFGIKWTIMGALFILFFAFAAKPAHAANIGLGIYPPVIQIEATAPTDIKSPMTITNSSDSTVNITILVRPFTASSKDNGELQYADAHTKIGEDAEIFQKMSIFDGQKNTEELTLAPNQKKNIELRISLPKDEPPSDYYFSITFLSNPIALDQGSNAAVAGGVSTNVLLSIGPKDKTTGFIKDYSAPFFLTSGPVPFNVLVANTSKHFISPQGTILVKNMFGQTIGKVDLLPVNILSNSSRYLPTDINNAVKAVWGEKFLLGPYAATLTLALSGEGPVYRQTIYFFALPVQFIIGIIITVILISIVVYRVRNQLKKS